MSVLRIPAVYMRGGTSKGVFFRAEDLPADPAVREALLLRVVGSPDPYGKQIDGMGGATSSTSKIVILAPSKRPDSDVDYLFGQVAIDRPFVDWTGNCGNLTAAVGPFAIAQGWVGAPRDGLAPVRIWQANIGKRILAHVPMRAGEVVEEGDFELDGVTFPAAEIRLEFLQPGGLGEGGRTRAARCCPRATWRTRWTYPAWATWRQPSSPRATRPSSSRRRPSACAARTCRIACRATPRCCASPRRSAPTARSRWGSRRAWRRRARGACTRPRSPS